MPTLDMLKAGQTARIIAIRDMDTALQTLRMGLASGDLVRCVTRLPGGGPVVIRCGETDVAMGQVLCRTIEVEIQ
jgi:Fe2+ transport system protein FeoA